MPEKKRNDLTKEQLYESVKSLQESAGPHLHLNQQKLFTLSSIAFQYLLFKSTKNPGVYLIRIEDGHLADKLAHKSKDDTTRRFMEKLLLPRRLKFGDSTFILDYFKESSWERIQEMPISRYRAALVVRNTTRRPFQELDEDQNAAAALAAAHNLDFMPRLMGHFAQTLTIAYDVTIPDAQVVRFDFITEEEQNLSGVKLADHLSLD